MPRTKEVLLGGKTYGIVQLTMRQNKEWRDKLGAPVATLIGLFQNADAIKFDSFDDIKMLLNVVKDLALGSMDIFIDLLFDYSPALRADRERIELEAYDDEVIEALGAILSMAYPLERVIAIFRGSPAITTSMSLPSTNGASGTKKPTVANRKST